MEKYKGQRSDVDYALYTELYSGYSPSIHNYNTVSSLGLQKVNCLNTLNLPKIVGEDYASLIIGERLEITTDIPEMDEFLLNKFIPDFAMFIEKVFAIGQGIIIPYTLNGKLRYKFYYGAEFTVKEWYNHRPRLIEIQEEKMTTNIEVIYELNKVITYISYKKKNNNDNFELPEDYVLNGALNYFKPNISNNITNDDKGLSVLANAIDVLKNIDTLYTDLMNEYKLSKKRALISSDLVTSKDDIVDGEVVTTSYFDQDEYLYQLVNTDEEEMIKFFDSNIRVSQYEEGIKFNLQILGTLVGLDEYYNYDKGYLSRQTATQVITDNSNLFRNKKKHEHLLEKELNNLVTAMLGLIGRDANEIVIIFDDAIIIDDDKVREDGIKLYESGLLSKEKYMIDYLHYTEEEVARELELLADVNELLIDNNMVE